MSSKLAHICLAASVTAILVTSIGCGNGASVAPTKYVAVADSSNNRVLLYSVPVTAGQAATFVLGQPDFTSSSSATSATGSSYPVKVAADSAGNVWVAECSNSRVVEYTAPFSNGMSATIVLGQPNMTTATTGTSATALGCPSGLAFDSKGDLWVSDYDNSRIVEFTPPFTSGMAASVALGQVDVNSRACTSSATGLCYPWIGMAFDSKDNLFVGDYDNSRIVEYQPPFSTGMAASVAIGQADLNSSVSGTTASNVSYPYGLAVDSSGNLWIADEGNNRVLRFNAPFTSGMSASLVLGQASFTTSSSATTASGTSQPGDVSFDSKGNLYVSEHGNNRSVMFAAPFSTGMNATAVLGEPDFVTSSCGVTSASLCSPYGVTAIP